MRRPAFQMGLLCTAMLFAGLIYAWSVLCGPLAVRLSGLSGTAVTVQDLSGAFGLSFFGSSAGIFLGGVLVRRAGFRASLALAALSIFAGFAGTAVSPSVWLLTLSYGLFYGTGAGMAFGLCMARAISLYPARRGFAGGLVSMAWGLSAAPMAIAAAWLVGRFGVRDGVLALGTMSATAVLLVALLSRSAPAEGEGAATHPVSANETVWTQMLRTADFYAMFAMLMFACMGSMLAIAHVASIADAQLGVSPGEAALFVSLLAVASTAGRFAAGALSDRIGRVPALLGALLLLAAGFAAMAMSRHGDTALFALGCAAVGLNYGAFCGVFPSFAADRFGVRELGRNYSFFNFACCVSGFLGPALIGLSGPREHFLASYAAAGLCALASAAIGLALMRSRRFACLCRK